MFGRWQGAGAEGNGRIDCPFCRDGLLGDAACGECQGSGIFECSGSGDPRDFISGPEHPDDFLELARLIFYARERAWGAREYLEESAVFIQAYQLFQGYTMRLFNEVQEKRRNEQELESRERMKRG